MPTHFLRQIRVARRMPSMLTMTCFIEDMRLGSCLLIFRDQQGAIDSTPHKSECLVM